MRIATRGSALALWQAHHVAGLLAARAGVKATIVKVETSGDRDTTSPLHSIGGKGVFCKEVQHAVLDGRADIAVHSAKDLPALTASGLELAAIPARGEVRDCLVGAALNNVPIGGSIATGSVRRRAQIAKHRPDIVFHELRGNIATRLSKRSGFDAIVMAAAALDRLSDDESIAELAASREIDVLPIETMVPQVGQGALAIECRAADDAAIQALGHINDPVASRLVRAERAFMAELGGDCSLPAAAHARGDAEGTIEMLGFLASEDLATAHQLHVSGDDGAVLGAELAATLRSVLTQP